MSIKYGERYIMTPVPVEALGTFLVIAYAYIDHNLEARVEVFKDCDQAKVGVGACDFDLRRNTATLLLEHRYGVAQDKRIKRLAHILEMFNGVGVLPVEQLDKIISEV